MKHPQILGNYRYKFGKSLKAPNLPLPKAPIATPQTITQQAQRAGTQERTRLRRRRGRAGTIFTGRRALQPARISAAELKQTL